jgi:hypothetical protein
MLTSADLGTIALGASSKATQYILECVGVKDLQNPTADEAAAVVQTMAMTLGYIELFLKLHLPAEEQDGVRAFIDTLSSGLANHVEKMQKKALDSAAESAIITPDSKAT